MVKSRAFQQLTPIEHDPNKKDKVYGWATWVPNRTPKFKAHVQRGHATSALSQHQYGVMYKLENGRWEEILNVPSRANAPLNCDSCGKDTWRASEWHQSKYYNNGRVVFDMKDDPPQAYWVCHSCR